MNNATTANTNTSAPAMISPSDVPSKDAAEPESMLPSNVGNKGSVVGGEEGGDGLDDPAV